MQMKSVSSFKPETQTAVVQNAEASSSIAKGEPCCFVYNGTNDGVAVVTPATGTGAKATSLFAGIAQNAIVAGQQGLVTRIGLNRYTKVLRQTRAATTDTWASFPAIAVGDLLVVDTVNNALSRNAAGASSGFLAFAMAAETAASATTLASSGTGASSTAVFSYIKTHLRSL